MSLQVLKTLPEKIYVAVSGGVDSMVALHFLSQKHRVTAIHYVHSDSDTAEAECAFVEAAVTAAGIPFLPAWQIESRDPALSREAHWRRGRYQWAKTFNGPVITGHHLDDAVEWYLMTALRGRGEFMPYSHANVVRPFLCNKKSEILDYAREHSVKYMHDATNDDVEYAVRNRVRHKILPEALLVNPGLYTVVRKRLFEREHGAQKK